MSRIPFGFAAYLARALASAPRHPVRRSESKGVVEGVVDRVTRIVSSPKEAEVAEFFFSKSFFSESRAPSPSSDARSRRSAMCDASTYSLSVAASRVPNTKNARTATPRRAPSVSAVARAPRLATTRFAAARARNTQARRFAVAVANETPWSFTPYGVEALYSTTIAATTNVVRVRKRCHGAGTARRVLLSGCSKLLLPGVGPVGVGVVAAERERPGARAASDRPPRPESRRWKSGETRAVDAADARATTRLLAWTPSWEMPETRARTPPVFDAAREKDARAAEGGRRAVRASAGAAGRALSAPRATMTTPCASAAVPARTADAPVMTFPGSQRITFTR